MSTPPTDQPAIRVTAMPADTNVNGDIFGGWIMCMMDLAAGNVAVRHSQGRSATVAIDAVSFHHPVHVGDELSVYAKLVSVGRTSMKIAVEAWQRDRDSDRSAQVTSATFTFVAIDIHGKPRLVLG